MRYLLNGGFEFQGESYYRVDDVARMAAEEADGSYDPIRHLRRFGVAINKQGVTPDQARAMVDAINKVLA